MALVRGHRRRAGRHPGNATAQTGFLPRPSVGLTEGSLTITSSTTDGAAPVLALVHPTAQWGAGSAVSLQIRDVLGPDGSALMGNGAVEDSDEALVFVRGRPVTVYSPGEID